MLVFLSESEYPFLVVRGDNIIVFKSIYALSLLKVVKKPVGSADVSPLKLAIEAKLGFRGKVESNSESA
jgi:hypothetical protein